MLKALNYASKRSFSTSKTNPYNAVKKSLKIAGNNYQYYSLPELGDKRLETLPYSIRVLLESAMRNCDEFNVLTADVNKILDWQNTSQQSIEIPFKPARVILQDFTGVPAVVDLAAMRDALVKLGGNPDKINPLCPVDLVIDHSVQVDHSRDPEALKRNEQIEFDRNYERFEFLKWGQNAFDNFLIVPPGSGIVHQVNLEYLARVVFNRDGILYPDSVVGTDSHTTMINGLGVAGWGVGGIEAESVMLGQCISMVLPQVIGFKLTGELPQDATATDLVLTVTQMLRKRGVVGKFVEFYGPGVNNLTLADRATIANMAPEYGATMGYFPIDEKSIDYLAVTNRSPQTIETVRSYLKAQGLFRTYDGSQKDPNFTGESLELDLGSIRPSISGPKRPHDRVLVSDQKKEWSTILTAKTGFKGFGMKPEETKKSHTFSYRGENHTIQHGAVVIAAITSCTNTSNPDVMIGAGLLARNAVNKGLKVRPYIKTSLSPGSGVVTKYFKESGVDKYLDKLGFNTAGYGCMTCIGNSGDLEQELSDAIVKGDILASAVLSGNRNFEGRVHPLTRANYLASPILVVAYALAGTVDIDFDKEPIGVDSKGKNVFLKDIWPSKKEISEASSKAVKPEFFKDVYGKIAGGTERWNALTVTKTKQYSWKDTSTYIHNPPYFQGMGLEPPKFKPIKDAYVLASFGDFVTTDHISPAGNIAKSSPAARYLTGKGVQNKDFNTYGARRGNDEIMARGTFANIRLINKMIEKVGPQTVYVPTKQIMDIYDAAATYKKDGSPLIILAGQEYGSGSSRDWAAKGPFLQGVRAVIAQSFERIHRSNLVGMGILPLEFKQGENAETLGLTGQEQFTINVEPSNLKTGQDITIQVSNGKKFTVKSRIDTDVEIEYYRNGGILPYVLRKLA